MAIIEVIYQDKGAEKVLSNAQAVDGTVSKLKDKLKSPLGLGDSLNVNDFTTKSRQVSNSFNHLGIEYERLRGKLKSPLGAGDSMLSPENFRKGVKGITATGEALEGLENKSKAAAFQLGFISRLLVAMVVRKVAHDVVELADAFTNFQNKIKLVTQNEDGLRFATEDLIKIANETRQPLQTVGELFSRTARSVASLGKTQRETTKFTETLSKAVIVGGSTATEASNALIQLSQGLSSGALKGDELRSVLEQMPIVAQIIADKMGVTIGALRKLGSEGKLTTQLIFDAVSSSTDKIDEAFAKMKPTIEGAFNVLKNKFLVAVGEASPYTDTFSKAILFLADNFDIAGRAAFSFLAVATALVGAKGIMAAASLLVNPWVALGVAVVGVITAFTAFKDTIQVNSDGVTTLGDLSHAMFNGMQADLSNLLEPIKKVSEAFEDMHPTEGAGGFDWDLFIARRIDNLRQLASHVSLIGAAAVKDPNQYEREVNRAREEAAQRAQQAEIKKLVEQSKRDELEASQQRYKVVTATVPTTKKKGHKESGKTFEELIREQEFDLANSIIGESEVASKIEKKLHDTLEKLKPSIAAWGKDIQAKIKAAQDQFEDQQYNYAISGGRDLNVEIRMRRELDNKLAAINKQNEAYEKQSGRLREMITREISDSYYRKAKAKEDEEYEKTMNKSIEERLKLMLEEEEQLRKIGMERVKAYDEDRMKRAKFGDTIAMELDPGIAINKKIQELEAFAELYKDFPEWVDLARNKIQELHGDLLTAGAVSEYLGQLKGIYGPGGMISRGFSDIAAKAITMNLSLRETRDLVNDLLAQVGQQALSSLFQFGINSALGALTSSSMPSAGGATGPTSGTASGVFGPGGAPTTYTIVPGHASGGYTGNYGTSQIAGVVHGQEYVVNAEATRKNRPMLEAINNGGTVDKSGTVVNVHNYAGVQVETQQLSKNEVEVMITRAIATQTPGVVANNINNSNSQISRSLRYHIDADRRRG